MQSRGTMNISKSLALTPNIAAEPKASATVNDMHSQLNATTVARIVRPNSVSQLVVEVQNAIACGQSIAISGGRHAMGGQQFLTSGVLLDMTAMNMVLDFNKATGLITVEAGILWPDLLLYLKEAQRDNLQKWTIAQKQTGCDNLSIGGALAANVHGRGLSMPPFVNDVESFSLVTATGDVLNCSRDENTELFRLVIGGYGMFGIVATVTMRLIPKTLLQRTVEVCTASDVVHKLESQINNGAKYGDFQFAIDANSPDFLNRGILSTYTPIANDAEHQPAANQKLLSESDWHELLYLAHANKSLAFSKYVEHYLATDGQTYQSDSFQLATYLDGYHKQLDARLGSTCAGTEMISELYVPRQMLPVFLKRAADVLRAKHANVIYGTVRLIERDEETFMPWAKGRWACTVLNLHIDHNETAIALAADTFRALIDLAIELNGCYYLTYHRFATREQVEACYPELAALIVHKKRLDPNSVFRSDWFDHHRQLLNAS